VDVTEVDDFIGFCDQNVSVPMGLMVNGYGVMGVSNSYERTPVNRSTFNKLFVLPVNADRRCEQIIGTSLSHAHAILRMEGRDALLLRVRFSNIF
jgi:hypothetical protein